LCNAVIQQAAFIHPLHLPSQSARSLCVLLISSLASSLKWHAASNLLFESGRCTRFAAELAAQTLGTALCNLQILRDQLSNNSFVTRKHTLLTLEHTRYKLELSYLGTCRNCIVGLSELLVLILCLDRVDCNNNMQTVHQAMLTTACQAAARVLPRGGCSQGPGRMFRSSAQGLFLPPLHPLTCPLRS